MELIESVARSLLMAHCEDMNPAGTDNQGQVDHEWIDWVPEANAAIRAMLDGVEPVAWRRHFPGHSKTRFHPTYGRVEVLHEGWTEEALYSLDALKEAVK